jgi:hypothetical protein
MPIAFRILLISVDVTGTQVVNADDGKHERMRAAATRLSPAVEKISWPDVFETGSEQNTGLPFVIHFDKTKAGVGMEDLARLRIEQAIGLGQ